MKVPTRLTAQNLLWRAYRQGVSIRLNGEGGLKVSPASPAAKALIPAIREHKPKLLALLAALEQCGAQDNRLILEALAMFNGSISAGRINEPVARQTAFEWAEQGEPSG